jgi:hypothetical protein
MAMLAEQDASACSAITVAPPKVRVHKMEGWLKKKGGVAANAEGHKKGRSPLSRRNWKQRWFQLAEGTLTYFAGNPNISVAKERGKIALKGCRVRRVDHGESEVGKAKETGDSYGFPDPDPHQDRALARLEEYPPRAPSLSSKHKFYFEVYHQATSRSVICLRAESEEETVRWITALSGW